MTRRALTDFLWEQLQATMKKYGCHCWKNDREIMEAILWKLRTGAPWRDVPEEFCPWETADNRFNRWAAKGLWDKFFCSKMSHPARAVRYNSHTTVKIANNHKDHMQIWVDADACPNVIKEILYRAAERTGTLLTLVANQPLKVPPSKLIRTIQVAAGFDVADNELLRRIKPGDLVITADIPLASEVLEKGGFALNPRGESYTAATIRERLTLRDFMDTMRASGIQTGGPAKLSPKERQLFANALDKWLASACEKAVIR